MKEKNCNCLLGECIPVAHILASGREERNITHLLLEYVKNRGYNFTGRIEETLKSSKVAIPYHIVGEVKLNSKEEVLHYYIIPQKTSKESIKQYGKRRKILEENCVLIEEYEYVHKQEKVFKTTLLIGETEIIIAEDPF